MQMRLKSFGRGAAKGPRGLAAKKKRDLRLSLKKKFCRFCADKTRVIDYKDVKRLEAFVNERGKITSSRVLGNCAKHQRRLVEAIKKAKFLSLLPCSR
jgi:small subunit ribosomal protein S18